MEDDVYKHIADRVKTVFSDEGDAISRCIDDVIFTLRFHHRNGLSHYDFAWVLLETCLDTMIAMDSLEEAEAFARQVRDSGERTRKIIAENWPPPDQKIWQWDPKRKGSAT